MAIDGLYRQVGFGERQGACGPVAERYKQPESDCTAGQRNLKHLRR